MFLVQHNYVLIHTHTHTSSHSKLPLIDDPGALASKPFASNVLQGVTGQRAQRAQGAERAENGIAMAHTFSWKTKRRRLEAL